MNLLDDKKAKNLQTLEARTLRFYIPPKIHKEDNPDRPVISFVNFHTTKTSKGVYHHLQLHIQELESYVKNSTDFIKKVSAIDNEPQKAF